MGNLKDVLNSIIFNITLEENTEGKSQKINPTIIPSMRYLAPIY